VGSSRVSKIALATAIVIMAGSGIGFIATLMLGAFVLDRYDAYGEVPIPGTGKLHLPAGQVTVSFHTATVGNSSGGGLPVPHLVLDIDPPAGVADPKVTESVGTSTSVNNDIHRRVWSAQIPAEGDYIITTSGEINGFISPRMASVMRATPTGRGQGFSPACSSSAWSVRSRRRCGCRAPNASPRRRRR
jgi:hypothetical protein